MASMIFQIGRQMLTTDPVLFKYGEQRRDYIYISDVIEAIYAATRAKNSMILNIGSGKGVSFNRIVSLFNQKLGLRRRPKYMDNPIKDKYQENVVLDVTLAKENLGFKPAITIEEGISRYIKSGSFDRCVA
jgi:ADP-L-glycero-D-manno-heptose 6-epimerase